MLAMAIVPVKLIRYEAVHSLPNAVTDPGFQHLPPMRVVQARPILPHAADAVALVRDRLAAFVHFQQIHGVFDGFLAEQLFVPLVAIEAKKAARPLRAFRIAHQEFNIEMPNPLHAASMQFGVEPRVPVAAFAVASHGEVRGVFAAKRRVRQSPEMRAVEAHLRYFGLHVIHEGQIARVSVTCPMGNEAGELKRVRGGVRTCLGPRNGRFSQVLSLASGDDQTTGEERGPEMKSEIRPAAPGAVRGENPKSETIVAFSSILRTHQWQWLSVLGVRPQ